MGTDSSVGVAAGARFDLRLQGRILGGLYLIGATLVLLTVVLPHSAAADDRGSLAIVAVAYAIGLLMTWRAHAVGRWMLPLVLALGSTLITALAYFSGQRPSPMVFFYLWVFLYAAYFFSRRETIGQIVYVAAIYAWLLSVRTPANAPAWWIVEMGTLLVAAVLVHGLRERAEQLIARLYDAARSDPLTGLPNRRGFRELLDLELERARRSGTRMTVVVGDLDHFKDVNDRAGHAVGDAVLQRVADLLRGGKRAIDVATRIGGEEFALILPDTDARGAFLVAERLRESLRETFAADTVPITISFGVATFPAHAETAASLLHAADEALYAAKESGRNRTVLHSLVLRTALREGRDDRDIEGERFLAVVLDLAEAVDVRFSGKARHSETVGRYAELMARELGCSEHRVGRVRLAGLLHDVGKVGVPNTILSKPGKLTDEEFAVIRLHPGLGEQILDHPTLADVARWVGAHHERPDGRGYPNSLVGDELPLEARIIAVADAYEAMTSDRSYRGAIGSDNARAELRRCSGTQFDADVVEAFLLVLERESERAEALLAERESALPS
jgi:diguanylate cyclase (GGDEF)-like protein